VTQRGEPDACSEASLKSGCAEGWRGSSDGRSEHRQFVSLTIKSNREVCIHHPRARGRTVLLMVELATVIPTGND
jgi:hypothetical protein